MGVVEPPRRSRPGSRAHRPWVRDAVVARRRVAARAGVSAERCCRVPWRAAGRARPAVRASSPAAVAAAMTGRAGRGCRRASSDPSRPGRRGKTGTAAVVTCGGTFRVQTVWFSACRAASSALRNLRSDSRRSRTAGSHRHPRRCRSRAESPLGRGARSAEWRRTAEPASEWWISSPGTGGCPSRSRCHNALATPWTRPVQHLPILSAASWTYPPRCATSPGPAG